MRKRHFAIVAALLCAPLLTGCLGSMNESGKAGASPADLSMSTKETKLKELENVILSGVDYGMDTVDLYFVDLMFTKKVLPTDTESLMGKGEEAWMYSLSDYITVVVDVDRSRPIAWFYGKAIDATELARWQEKY